MNLGIQISQGVIVPVKIIAFLFLVMIIMPAESQVNISGSVLDGSTKAPIIGAAVKVCGLNLSSTTDQNGNFNISGTSIRRIGNGHNEIGPVINEKLLLYHHETDGAVMIRIFDLSGKRLSDIFSGILGAGDWRIVPPKLSPGIYLCKFDTPRSHQAFGFLVSATSPYIENGKLYKLGNASGTSPVALNKQMAASGPVDSLLVTKLGYRQAYFPLDSYQQNGLSLLLVDTSKIADNDATIIPDPSWTCFMPDGIPPPERGEQVFSIMLQYSALHDVGITQFGHRRLFDIKSGTLTGDRIKGTFLTGGLDLELTLSNGSVELEQIDILRTNNDNIPILMRNAGVAPAGENRVRVVLDFEAPNSSSYTWLNTGKFAASRIVDTTAKTITLNVYDISKVALPEKGIRIADPSNVPNQTWECLKLTGSKGTSVFTESVSLGSSITIGASKRGSRNIIPITGGTTTGRVEGKILPGGADYQLSGLDARYTLAPSDGELIIVRNCGATGALIPVFEARTEGPYAFLNENKYLSSDPSMAGSGVKITFYEKK